MKNPARAKFVPLLSPYIDGELSAQERRELEQHLAHSPESAAQVADFRAGSALTRESLDMLADDVDWKAFTNEVMGKVAKEPLPFFSRMKLLFSELFTYQRGPLLAGMVGAAAAVAIAVPVSMKLAAGAPEGYANARVEVQSVQVTDDAFVRPVVMETDDGDAVIWVVDDKDKKKKKKDGEEKEEEVLSPPKQGDL
jgi:anti-sigma factor RsiW